VQDGVEVAHQDEGDGDLVLDGLQLGEEELEGHAVLQGLGGSGLDDGAIGQRVAEGNADLDEIDAAALHREDDVSGAIEGRGAGTEIEGEEFLVLWPFGEYLVYFIHCFMIFKGLWGQWGL